MKERESNFELLRCIAMMMVVLLHCNYFVLGNVVSSEIEMNPLGSFWRMFADQICTPCVNLFILISGWFGINPKLRGGASLLFQVVFYTVLSIGICFMMDWGISFEKIKASLTCQQGYWFIWPYLLLYITSPALNLLVEKAPLRIGGGVIASLLIYEFSLDWVVYYSGGGGGKSYIAFVTLYLIARMMATYDFKVAHYKRFIYLGLFILMSLLPTIIAFWGEQCLHFQFGKSAYTNPFVIMASVSLMLWFSKMHLVSKSINWLACSSFSIYLLHMNPLIAGHFKEIMLTINDLVGANIIAYTSLAVGITLLFSLACMCIDKIRIFIWNKISFLR